MPAIDMPGWEKRPNTENDWERYLGDGAYCAISQYAGSDDYCWHAVRGEARLHAIAHGREAAMQKAEEAMALSVEEFNDRAVAMLIDEMQKLEKTILRIAPHKQIMAGYQAGFEDGVNAARRKIIDALDASAL